MQNSVEKLVSGAKYIIKKNSRVRSLRISVYPDGRCVVSAPSFLSESRIESFVRTKSDWIISKLKGFVPFKPMMRKKNSQAEFKKYKNIALVLAQKQVLELNKNYGFKIGKITIRNQRSRWGSCSAKGNLNFNYKIALLPRHLSDYIIVHELCHLKEMNHSISFWNLVAEVFPNHHELRKELRKQGMGLG